MVIFGKNLLNLNKFLDVNVISGGDSNDTAPVGTDEISVELMDTNYQAGTDETSTGLMDTTYQVAGDRQPNNSSRPFNESRPIESGTTGGRQSGPARQIISAFNNTTRTALTTTGSALNWAINRVRQESESGRENADSQNTGRIC